MGADIHIFLQTRKNKATEWITGDEIEVGRYYEFFDLINNVRGFKYHPIAKPAIVDISFIAGDYQYTIPKDFGEDALQKFKLFSKGNWDKGICLGEHSFCILTPKDMFNYKYYHHIDDIIIYEMLSKILFKMLAATKSKDNARCIIGFDS